MLYRHSELNLEAADYKSDTQSITKTTILPNVSRDKYKDKKKKCSKSSKEFKLLIHRLRWKTINLQIYKNLSKVIINSWSIHLKHL
jgi:hypothetical protein